MCLPLRKIIKSRKPDVLIATMLDANVVATASIFGLNSRPVLVLRETNSHRFRPDLGILRKTAASWAYKSADKVIALSVGVGHELATEYGISQQKIAVIPNPVDINKLSEEVTAARNKPAPWGDRFKDCRIVISVGRLTEQKGFDLLIDSISMIKQENVVLVILGDGPDRDILRNKIYHSKMESRVLMPGYVEKPADWLVHSELFVLSSRWEGFGHVIIEAMVSGIPVIATDCPYGPQDIIIHGCNGWLVPSENSKKLSESIMALLLDDRKCESFVKAGKDMAKSFDAEIIASRYLALFEELIDKKNATC